MGGGGLAVMDDAFNWGTSAFGGFWMQVAMHEIMHNLGFGHSFDLPPDQIMGDDFTQGTSELVLPGIGDLTTGLNMFRPDSGDINMYKVTLTTPGTLSAETIAQRLADPSLLNTELRVFQLNADGSYSPIAQNDDYFSNDSYVSLPCQPGTYFVGVSASGNNAYDPSIPNSGMNGTTTGPYQLRVDFTPQETLGPAQASASGNIVLTGTNITVNTGTTPFAQTTGKRLGDDQANRSVRRSQRGGAEWRDIHRRARNRIVHVPVRRHVDRQQSGGGGKHRHRLQLDHRLDRHGPRRHGHGDQRCLHGPGERHGHALRRRRRRHARRLVQLLVQRGGSGTVRGHRPHDLRRQVGASGGNGGIAAPYTTISAALAAAANDARLGLHDIVRIEGNHTSNDNPANLAHDCRQQSYNIGTDIFGNALSDGATMVVPRDTTVMIDAGAVLKFRAANIQVGSSSRQRRPQRRVAAGAGHAAGFGLFYLLAG